ncbi:WYL domain-containing protein [Agromyces endophyticus]|uniref:helix-turn-helix transcriptional regulator n=1 Tax=Agromyces sp. H17E-10 TaxID=2932244 RepID=UPI001FD44333|nr:WYL domain-containing protein [Agromyces sp. H17E-10]UOQ90384.1 WYL domain-containing protein [Agromyces sp. H17E-10]
MRADRLVATLLVMQARGRVTARQLAEELEISVATARRDLEALSAAGIPVYPQPGRGGGWQLLGEGRTDLSGFTAAEARALFLLFGPRAGESEAARSALRKVLRALPATFRAEAEAAAESIVVDSGGWDAPANRPPAAVAALQAAVLERRVVGFEYTRWGGEPTARRVRPLGLIDTRGTWYLIGEPAADAPGPSPRAATGSSAAGQRRSYRVDRMADVEALADRFEPPADFDLDAAWAELRDAARSARSRAEAVVLVDAGVAAEFRGWLGAEPATSVEPADAAEPDGRVRLRVTAPSETVLVRRLAGWASACEVVEPERLRVALAGVGAALTARYP